MWAHLLASYIIGFIVLHEVTRACRQYAAYRRRYLETPRQRTFAVLLRDIPRNQADEERLRQQYSNTYSELQGVMMVRHAPELRKCAKRRLEALHKLARVQAVADRRHEHRHVTYALSDPAVMEANAGSSGSNGGGPITLPSSQDDGVSLYCACCRSERLANAAAEYERRVIAYNRQVSRPFIQSKY